ncbi:hypothetical protein ADK34_41670 [Streptomyces viridochromogenes]|uniref:Uncharacterized protein n=2 Tax=Streptomyces viridochromogenes TaxID=1938 RepID=A0A0L8IZH5_STRVR|nr:hypothetical protein [Streptomyces wedmorensis]KOG06798.1 hypothetical protein ADK34_41670 [Streptomyces viridochromogenes]
MGAPRLVRLSGDARPMALASAVATLLAALFLCLGAGPDRQDPHHEPGESLRAVTVVGEYVCPYDRGGCSLFPSLSPAVLSAPPLDPPLDAAGGPPRLAAPPGDGPARRSGAQPRAPDLHVLQVLRT